MHNDHHRLVVHGLDAKDITKFFDENTALDRDGSVVGSLSFARSVPIPPNQPRDEIKQWLDENWGWGVYEDASNTTHKIFVDGKAPKVDYKFYTKAYTQIHRWIEKISVKYPNLFFELDPQWDGEYGETWHEHGGESYTFGSDSVYLWKDGVEYRVEFSNIYLLGILNPNLKLECRNWGVSFRQDLQKVEDPLYPWVTPEGRLNWFLPPVVFNHGGRTEYMKGRHRTMFIVACYFTVLIDQVFHSHYQGCHSKYGRLAKPVKISLTAGNAHPDCLLECDYLRDDPDPESAFCDAIPVVEKQLKDLVRQHFPELKPDEVWRRISSYLPTEYPVFR